jgi:hypothetical protein
MALVKLNTLSRSTFVRSSVEENDVTTFVIDAIMPYFPRGTKVIGGYVDGVKQYWKANFHWEYLLKRLNKALESKLSAQHQKCVQAIRSALIAKGPSPDRGYTTSKVMGLPRDVSSRDTVIRRWKNIRQCKRDFKSVMAAAKLLKGTDTKTQKVWLLAIAPVAKPGTSRHSTGYAIDLYGDNAEIVKISKALGASVVFPEGSHVHVEFGNGVAGKPLPKGTVMAATYPGSAGADDSQSQCLLSPAAMAELKQSTKTASASGDFAREVSYRETLSELFEDSLGEDWWSNSNRA